jgi:hypothetical protein
LKWLTHLDDYEIQKFDDPTDIPKYSDQSWTALMNLPSLLADSLATLRGSSLATSLSANSPTQPHMLSTSVSSLEAKSLPEAAAESSAELVQKWQAIFTEDLHVYNLQNGKLRTLENLIIKNVKFNELRSINIYIQVNQI